MTCKSNLNFHCSYVHFNLVHRPANQRNPNPLDSLQETLPPNPYGVFTKNMAKGGYGKTTFFTRCLGPTRGSIMQARLLSGKQIKFYEGNMSGSIMTYLYLVPKNTSVYGNYPLLQTVDQSCIPHHPHIRYHPSKGLQVN